MTVEREVKAVVSDPAAARVRLLAAGATPRFRGMMADRRYDADGTLGARDEVLRVRRYRAADGRERTVLAWKGPVSVEGGHKLRREHEVTTPDGDAAVALVSALGYRPVHAIDRYVEYYEVEGAVVRLEWFPRMDVLVEVEGGAESIDRAIAATGIPREDFTAEPLTAFQQRFELRAGLAAVLSTEELGGDRPGWDGVA